MSFLCRRILRYLFHQTIPIKPDVLNRYGRDVIENGEWCATRLLNGDETWHNSALIAVGRLYDSCEMNKSENISGIVAEQNFTYSYNHHKKIATPGIYKAKVYVRD